MSCQHFFSREAVARYTFALGLFAILPVAEPTAVAADDLSCIAEEGCAVDCAEEPLTGPLGSSVYTPTEPIADNEYVPPLIQQSAPPATQSVFSEGVEGTLAAQGHAPGYIDWAAPRTQFRMRFDAGFDNNRPDRAEFFYAQCGCGGGPGPGVVGPPPTVNGSVDYQDLRGYLEIANSSRFSVFGEIPVRFLQTSTASNLGVQDTGDAAGISDMEAGFKYAIIRDANNIFTFQLKNYIPTGNASQGLGTNHYSIEPGFLAQSRINSRLDVFAELRDWIPVDGSRAGGQNFAGNVLRYGVGAAYSVVDTTDVQISPILEFVGWSVLDGQVLNTDIGALNVNAATTIVNVKGGLRTMFKDNGSTLYVGYGHALTGQRWYEDIVRLEYTIFL